MHDPAPDDVLGANAKHQLMHVIMKSSQQWDAMQPMACGIVVEQRFPCMHDGLLASC
jgi:hypothetical protein